MLCIKHVIFIRFKKCALIPLSYHPGGYLCYVIWVSDFTMASDPIGYPSNVTDIARNVLFHKASF